MPSMASIRAFLIAVMGPESPPEKLSQIEYSYLICSFLIASGGVYDNVLMRLHLCLHVRGVGAGPAFHHEAPYLAMTE